MSCFPADVSRGLRVTFLTFAILSLAIGASYLPGNAGRTSRVEAKSTPPSKAIGPVKTAGNLGKLPLSFEPNRGQSDSAVRFISRGPGYTVFLTQAEAVFELRKDISPAGSANIASKILNPAAKRSPAQDNVLRVQLVKPNLNAAVTGLEQLPGRTNYLHGKDPSRWSTHVPTYSRVQYADVFPGVNLVYYGNNRQLEYDFVVGAGTDANVIGLRFAGARNVRVDSATGDLVASVGKENIRFNKPVAYQNDADGGRREIAAQYAIDANRKVSFALGAYDHDQALVIDPTLSYSTYIGGSGNETATSIAVDNAGNSYLIGYTDSTNFPTTSGALQTACSGGCSNSTTDAYISKIDPTGSFLIYSTYLGGSGNDIANGIALDASGNAYVAGQTSSVDFPTTAGAFQTACGDLTCTTTDAFVTELNADGSGLVYSTYLGGSRTDQVNNIILDSQNNAYVTGFTQSSSFPVTPSAFQKTCCTNGKSVAFITKLNSTGTALVYSTFLGGNNGDVAYTIALDLLNDAYIVGYTRSKNFPVTTHAFQKVLNADTAAFVAKTNTTGSAMLYSTYLGGTSSATVPCKACAVSVTVDKSGSAYVTGLTADADFPITAGAFQSAFKSTPQGHDAFITKFDPTGSSLMFSTYFGGSADDGATGVLLDASGNVWFKGNTMSTDLPVTPGAYQVTSGGNFDAYLAELDPTGSTLLYSTYLGGSGIEFGGATRMLALDTQNPPNIYLTGYTTSTNFPVTPGALQSSNAGLNDSYATKFVPSANIGLSAALNFGNVNDGTSSSPQTVTVTNTGNENLTFTGVSITGTNTADFAQTNTCSSVAPRATCTATVTFTPTITGSESASVSFADNAAGSPHLVALSGSGIGSGPSAVISPSSLTFPSQILKTSSAPQTVTLSNVGNSALSITSILTSGDFSQTNTCGSSVSAGASCTISVVFTPTNINTRTGTLTLTDNSVGSPQSLPLTGVGSNVSISPTSLNFGTVTVGTSSAVQNVTFTNKGRTSLTIQKIALGGKSTLDFTETNTCGTSVAANASCTISVTFTPTIKGVRTASVTVFDGGGGSPQMIPLSGTGQ